MGPESRGTRGLVWEHDLVQSRSWKPQAYGLGAGQRQHWRPQADRLGATRRLDRRAKLGAKQGSDYTDSAAEKAGKNPRGEKGDV